MVGIFSEGGFVHGKKKKKEKEADVGNHLEVRNFSYESPRTWWVKERGE